MIDQETSLNMRKQYKDVIPLVFHRSVEYAKDAGDLFDILEALPKELPVIWDSEKHRWVTTDDLTQSRQFEMP
jgi:hypothetical protein